MEQAQYVRDVQQARILFKPLRLEIMRQLANPQTCQDLAETFGASPQKIYYHVKKLEHAGFVQKVAEQRVRGLMQGIYQATARSYWISRQLVDRLPQAKETMSLSYLLGLAEQVHMEAGYLTAIEQDTPTLAINAQVELANIEDRAAFLEELQGTLTTMAERYGVQKEDAHGSEIYRLIVASYPIREGQEED